MMRLLQILLPDYLKRLCKVLGAAIIIRCYAAMAFDDLMMLDATIIFMFFNAALWENGVLFGKNLGWMMSLPLKKGSLIFSKYVYSFIVFISCGIAATPFFILFLKDVPDGGKVDQADPILITAVSLLGIDDPRMLLISVIIFWAIHTLMFCFILGPDNPVYIPRAAHIKKRDQKIYLGISVLLSLIIYFFRRYCFSTWGGAVLGILFVGLVTGATGICCRLRRDQILKIVVIHWIVGGLSLVIPIQCALSHRNSPVPGVRAVAYGLLYPFLKIETTELVQMFQVDLGDTNYYRLVDIYKDILREEHLSEMPSNRVSLNSLLVSQRNLKAPARIRALIDPKSVDGSELLHFFEDHDLKSVQALELSELVLWFVTPTQIDALTQMLLSKSKSAQLYALVKVRYERKPEYIGTILSSLPELDESLRGTALKTLSLLSGQKQDVDQWSTLKSASISGKHPLAYFDGECDHFEGFKFSQEVKNVPIEEGEWSRLNVCMRNQVRLDQTNLILWIENLPWMKTELDQNERNVVKRVFGKHLR